MADPLQGRLAIFGQFDEHTVGLPLLQGAEEALGGAGTVVANAEDFVHWVMSSGLKKGSFELESVFLPK